MKRWNLQGNEQLLSFVPYYPRNELFSSIFTFSINQLSILSKWCKWFYLKYFINKNEVKEENQVLNEEIQNLFYRMSIEQEFKIEDSVGLCLKTSSFQSANKLKNMIKQNKERDIVIVTIQPHYQADISQYTSLWSKVLDKVLTLELFNKSKNISNVDSIQNKTQDPANNDSYQNTQGDVRNSVYIKSNLDYSIYKIN